MASKGALVIRFIGDTKDFNRKLSDVQSSTSKFGKVGKVAAVGAAAVGAAAVIAGKQLWDMGQQASDLNETLSKTNQIFGGKAAKGLEKWAAGAAVKMGQSKQQALDAAATFGVFGKAAGKSGEGLATFAKQNSQLASDLASFHNTSPEEAITAIGAAFRGEMEPIRRFGVLLDDASLRQQALKMGLVSTTKDALKPQQKVLAAQALIMKQTKDAQGDFARTSGGLANQQRILSAQFDNLKASVGKAALPVMLKLVTFTNGTLIPGAKKVWSFLKTKLGPVFAEVGGFIKKHVLPAFAAFGGDGPSAIDKVRAKIAPLLAAFAGLVGVLRPIVEAVVNLIRDNWGKIADWARDNFGQVKVIAQTQLDLLVEVVRKVTALVKGIWERFGGNMLAILTAVFKTLGGVVSGALQIVKGIIKTVLSVIRGDWKGAWSGIKSILSGAWQVITSLVKGSMRVLWEIVKVGWALIKEGFTTGISKLIGLVKSLPGKIVRGLSNLHQTMLNLGMDAIRGLIGGIKSMAVELVSTIKSYVIDKIPGPLKKALGISSPSKVFAEMGRNLIQGLNAGIRGESQRIPGEIARVGRMLGAGTLPALSSGGVTAAPGGPPPGRGGATVTRVELSPRAIRQALNGLEIVLKNGPNDPGQLAFLMTGGR